MTRVAPARYDARRAGAPGPDRWLSLVAFVTPTLLWAQLWIGGRVFAPELLLIGLLPFLLLVRGRMLAEPLPRTFLALLALWLAGQILTDLVRETELRDYARGWSKIVFTALNFCALYLLLHGSRRRLVLFGLGLATGEVLSHAIAPSVFAQSHPWKFGMGPPAALLAALSAMWRPLSSLPLLPAMPLFLICAYSTLVGARALAGIALSASFYILVQQVLGRRNDDFVRPSTLRVFLFGATGVTLAAFLLYAFDLAIETGYVLEEVAATTRRQSEGAFGLLLGGRSELFASGRAVMDSPLLGHGSWAKSPDYAARILDARLQGYAVHLTSHFETDLIPTHSHLMGAWVEAGILGIAVWLWSFVFVVRVLAHLYRIREPLGPLVAFFGFLILWDILFSPFGAERRLTLPFALVLMMSTWDALRTGLPRAAPASARGALQPPRHPRGRGGR